MNKNDPTDLKPCPHMRTLVSAWIDGKLTGLAKWYTERHIHDCERCSKSIRFLQRMRDRLRGLAAGPATSTKDQLSGERWDNLDSALDSVERQVAASNEWSR